MVRKLKLDEFYKANEYDDLLTHGDRQLANLHELLNDIDDYISLKFIDTLEGYAWALENVLDKLNDGNWDYVLQYVDITWLDDFIEKSAKIANDVRKAINNINSANQTIQQLNKNGNIDAMRIMQ